MYLLPRYVHTGDSQSAFNMLNDMVADGVRPDLFSYSTVLACVSLQLGWIKARMGREPQACGK